MATTEIDRCANFNYDIISKSDHKYFGHLLSKKYFWQTSYYNDVFIYNKEIRRSNSILSNHSTETIYENEVEDKYKTTIEDNKKDQMENTLSKDEKNDSGIIIDTLNDHSLTDNDVIKVVNGDIRTRKYSNNSSGSSINMDSDSDIQSTCCCDDTNEGSKSASQHDLRPRALNGYRKHSLTDLRKNSLTDSRKNSLTDLRKHSLISNSSGNLNGSSRPKNHVDITETQMYKEIYADNLRQYSFLLAKQLCSSSQSPHELRKSYLKSRQKAIERRERAHTGGNIPRRSSIPDHTLEKTPLTNSAHELSTSKYTGSLTDITNIGNGKESVRKSAINRRKHSKVPKGDPKKRLSLPQFESIALADIENEIGKQRKSSVPNIKILENSIPISTLAAPEFINVEERKRKLSGESLRRQSVAKERFEYRMNKLKSFDDVLHQAGDLVKDYKRKLSNNNNHDKENSSSDESDQKVVNKELSNKHNTNMSSTNETNTNEQSTNENKTIEKVTFNNKTDINTTNYTTINAKNMNTNLNNQISSDRSINRAQ